MRSNPFNNKDFCAGVMLIAIGGGAALIARDYSFGSAFRMGPGYFPTVLGGVLALFGIVLVVRGLRSADMIAPGWSLRAMILLPASMILFGYLMDHAGFVPALAVLIFGSAAASSEFKFIEVAALTVVLLLLSVGIFIEGLKLPYPLFVGF